MKDPLKLLREDTYSNEETNEMVGKMIRDKYLKEQVENSFFPKQNEKRLIELKDGHNIELDGTTEMAYYHRTGFPLFSFKNMSEDEFNFIIKTYKQNV